MSIKLNSGYDFPKVGFGLWKLANDTAADQVYNAIKVGYRHFDGAQDYANEKEVGDGFRRAIDEGLVSRDELFITSKLWNAYHEPKNAEAALDRTLSDLGLDYLDLFLIHFPITFRFVPFEERYPAAEYTGTDANGKVSQENVPILETWKALEKLVASGKIRSIGISNFSSGLILDLLRGATIKPAVLQIEHHPYLQQKNLIDFVQREGIAVTAYSSFGAQSYIVLNNQKAIDAPSLLEHDVITSIAKAHKKNPSQVLLRWANQRNIVVIPKSSNPDRLYDNLHIDDFDLTESELAQIAALDKNLRFNDPADWAGLPIFD